MTPDRVEALRATARLFGRLFLFELDEDTRVQLVEPEFAAALGQVGISVAPLEAPDALDALAVEFFEAFVQPQEGGPPVQSLWTEGSYEGDAAASVRRLAEAVGVEFDRAAARGAPHDHLGCLLLLWAETREARPDVAERLEAEHLAWARAPLGRLAAGQGFYADVSRATLAWLEELLAPRPSGGAPR